VKDSLLKVLLVSKADLENRRRVPDYAWIKRDCLEKDFEFSLIAEVDCNDVYDSKDLFSFVVAQL
jgi:hypothetical protein